MEGCAGRCLAAVTCADADAAGWLGPHRPWCSRFTCRGGSGRCVRGRRPAGWTPARPPGRPVALGGRVSGARGRGVAARGPGGRDRAVGGAAASGTDLGLWASVSPLLATVPVTVLFCGLAVFAFGAFPWLTIALPVTVAVVAYLLDMIAAVLELPAWVHDLPPFQWLPMPPAEPWTPLPSVALTLIGVAFAAVGIALREARPAARLSSRRLSPAVPRPATGGTPPTGCRSAAAPPSRRRRVTRAARSDRAAPS